MNAFQAVEDPRARSTRAWALDVWVVLVLAVFAAPHILHDPNELPTPHWLAYLASAGMVLPLLVRRIWPLSTFALVVAVAVVAGAWNTELAGNLAVPVALYTLASLGSRRQAYVGATVLEVLAVIGAVRIAAAGGRLVVPCVLLTGMVAAALGLGLYAATRRAYVQELVDRATHLEHERDQADRLAVAAERARIAREMHDIVAHHLTVMVALSDAAARLVRSDADRAKQAMSAVAATGRDALRDTRRVLGVLNESVSGPDENIGHHDRDPVPGLTDVDRLLDQVRAAGLPVEIGVHGSPVTMAADAQLAVYRLIQESLTNTMKHARPGAHATVMISFGADALELRIDDDGAGHPVAADWRPGRGTSGMRARIHAVGGELRCGPHEPAGWRVSARLPLETSDTSRSAASPVRGPARTPVTP